MKIGSPKVSVIIPVHNTDKYLAQCLASVRNQTLRDIEILCVDDGSTDQSLSILEMCASVDERIRIITKDNGGVSSARNVGIRAARGMCVMFLDSDDFIDKRACEKIYMTMKASQADIITFGGNCYPPSSATAWLIDSMSPRNIVYDGFDIDIIFKEKSRPYIRCALHSDFLKRTGLLFDEELMLCEDHIFLFFAYVRSRKTVFISDKFYYYRFVRADSIMATKDQDLLEKAFGHALCAERVFEDWQENGILLTYANEMLEWYLSFSTLGYEGLRFREPDKSVLMLRLKKGLDRHFRGLNPAKPTSYAGSTGMRHEARETFEQVLSTCIKTGIKEEMPDFVPSNSRILELLGTERHVSLATGQYETVFKERSGYIKRVLKRILPLPARSTRIMMDDLRVQITSSIERAQTIHDSSEAIYLLTLEYIRKKDADSLYPVAIEDLRQPL
ncbi:MAG: glycosyltransferase family 2 protein [Coriobacteriia bacterium]|nr:glycosyltransferase family 2 protein [Coriobacteriia bacterium]